MIRLLLKWLVSSAAVYFAAWLLPAVHIEDFSTALWVSLVLGLVNILVKPFLVLISIPLILISLGIFLWIINAAMLMLCAWMIDGFWVESLFQAMLASAIISIITGIAATVLDEPESKT